MAYGERTVGPTPSFRSKIRFTSLAAGPEDVSMKVWSTDMETSADAISGGSEQERDSVPSETRSENMKEARPEAVGDGVDSGSCSPDVVEAVGEEDEDGSAEESKARAREEEEEIGRAHV